MRRDTKAVVEQAHEWQEVLRRLTEQVVGLDSEAHKLKAANTRLAACCASHAQGKKDLVAALKQTESLLQATRAQLEDVVNTREDVAATTQSLKDANVALQEQLAAALSADEQLASQLSQCRGENETLKAQLQCCHEAVFREPIQQTVRDVQPQTSDASVQCDAAVAAPAMPAVESVCKLEAQLAEASMKQQKEIADCEFLRNKVLTIVTERVNFTEELLQLREKNATLEAALRNAKSYEELEGQCTALTAKLHESTEQVDALLKEEKRSAEYINNLEVQLLRLTQKKEVPALREYGPAKAQGTSGRAAPSSSTSCLQAVKRRRCIRPADDDVLTAATLH